MYDIAPTKSSASKHTFNRTKETTAEFKEIYRHIINESDIPTQNNTSRTLDTELFPKKGETISLWIPFSLHYIHLLYTMAPTMPLNHLFEHGNYVGNKTPPTKNAPMDNNFLTSTTSIIHRIDNIGNLAIINSNGRLLNKQQRSYILFDFKEQRNQGPAVVVDIENYTNSWLKKASGVLFMLISIKIRQ